MAFLAFGYDGSIRIDTHINSTGFLRGIDEINRGFDGMNTSLKKLGGMIATVFGAAAIIKFGSDSIEAASDLSDAWMGLVSIVEGQGKSFSKAKSFINAYISDGLVPLENAVTAYKNLAARGYSTDQIEQTLTRLKDAAAFGRQSSYTLGEAISTATEGLKNENSILVDNAGVTKNVAKMWDEYAKSIGTTAKNLTQQQKIQAEVNGIMEETSFQVGDAAKLAGTYSGQLAMLSFNYQKLKVAVGEALIPIAQAVLPGIDAIISALTKLANMFAKVTAMLFGKSTKVVATGNKQMAQTAGAAAKANDNLAKSLGGAGSAAKKAAEEAETAVAAFDEFNILSFPDKSGGSGSGSGGAGDGFDPSIPDVDDAIGDYEAVQEEFETLADLFVKMLEDMLAAMPKFKQALLDFADAFNDFNQKLYDAFKDPRILPLVEELGRQLADALNALVNAIDWNLWGRTLGAGLNLGLQFLTEFLYNFDWINLGRKLADFINGLASEIDWYDFGRLLWAGFKIALETLGGFLVGLDMPLLAQAASNIVKGFFDEMKNTIERIPWEQIGMQIAKFLNNIDWVGIIKSIGKALGSMVDAAVELVSGFIKTADTGSIVAAILALGLAALNASKGKLKTLFEKVSIPVGLVLVADSIQDILFGNGLTWKNILEGAAGGALAGAGLGANLASKLGLTWVQGVLGGAVIGLGVSLLIESIADIIADGLNIGNSILGAIGGAIAGAAAGFLYMGGSGGAILGASIGVGISLVIESITDVAVKGLNLSNGVVGLIGGALAGAGIGFYLGGPLGAAIGATIGAGVSIAIEGIVAQLTGGIDILGAIMTVLGTALAGAGIGFAVGGIPGAIAGAVIGLAAGVVIEITGIDIAGEKAYAATEDFQTMTRVIEECEDAASRSSTAMETLGRNIDGLNTSLADVGAAQSLVDEIYEINENANASAYELEMMATKVEILNGMGLNNLHLTIDETTGRIVETKEATDQLIASLQKEAEAAALQQLLVQAYKDRYTAVADAETAVKSITVAEQALAQTEKELTNTPFWDVKRRAELTAQEEKQTEALQAATEARNESVAAYDQLNGAIDTYSVALTDLDTKEADVGVELEKRMDSVRSTVEGVANDMPGYGRNIGDGLEQGMSEGISENETKSIFERIGDWFKNLFGIHSPSTVFKEFGENLVAGLINGIKETWDGVLEFFKTGVDAIKEFFSGAWEDVKSKTSDAWNAIKETVSGIWDGIKEKAGTVFDGIKETIGTAWDGLKEKTSAVWDEIKTTLGTLWDGLKEKVGTIFDGIKEKISTIWDNIKEKTSTIWDNIKTTLSTAWDNLKTAATEKFENIKTAISTAWDNVKAKTTEIWNSIKTTLSTLWNELKTTVTTVFTEIKNKVVEVWTTIKNEAVSKWNEIKSAISEKIENIKTAVSEGFAKVKDTITGKVTEAIDALKNKDWASVGRGIVDGIANGLNGIFDKLRSWASRVWDSVSSAFDGGGKSSGSGGRRTGSRAASYSAYRMTPELPAGYSAAVLPKLANGAVIPPNRQFAAILGDQRSGVNIETPLKTIETALQNVMERYAGSGDINITVESVLDGKVIARNTVTHINDMTRSAGKPVLLF